MTAPRDTALVATHVPARPSRLLILAHGYPWPDGSLSDNELADYARTAVRRWSRFADANDALLVAPVFGGVDFPDYRNMVGRTINPAELVSRLVDDAGSRHIRGFRGRFSLHGHSAGAQFAARYLVTCPERLQQVVLSAPSTYPFPDLATPWPYGMGPTAGDGHRPLTSPDPDGWLKAATEVPARVLVGDRDTESRPPAPGQSGSTRLERAAGWVDAMQHYAEAHERDCTVSLVVADGLDHDEAAMAIPAQELLSQMWHRQSRE